MRRAGDGLASRAAPSLAAALLALAAAGCDGWPLGRKDVGVAAWVGEKKVTVNDVVDYLAANLVRDDDADVPAEVSDEIRSRLLDALIEEWLLLHEAERRGIEVSDVELTTYIRLGGREREEQGPVSEAKLRQALRRLKLEKLRESVLMEQAPPTREEIRAYAEAHRERLVPAKRVRLRSLRLASKEDADKARDRIRRRLMTFDEAVVAFEQDPGQGLPLTIAWAGMDENMQAALEKLRPRQVSRPVELGGEFYLFQVVAWLEAPTEDEDALMRLAVEELEAERRVQLHEEMLAGLRKRIPVRIVEKNLPFRYVERSSG